MEPKLDFKGFEQIADALSNLPNAVSSKVLKEIGTEALEPIATRAAALAPERSGRLSFSITVSTARTRRAKKGRDFGGATATGGKYVQVAMGPGSGLGTLYYAWWQEFGTVRHSARPFMRPAWDAGKAAAQAHVASNIWSKISAAAGKEAKKAERDAKWFAKHQRR